MRADLKSIALIAIQSVLVAVFVAFAIAGILMFSLVLTI